MSCWQIILPNNAITEGNAFDLPDKVVQTGTAAINIVVEIVEESLESSEMMIKLPSFIWSEWEVAKLICKELEFEDDGAKWIA